MPDDKMNLRSNKAETPQPEPAEPEEKQQPFVAKAEAAKVPEEAEDEERE